MAATVYDNNTPSVETLTLSTGDYEFARTDDQYVVNHLTLSGASVRYTATGSNQIGTSLVLSSGTLDLNGYSETLSTLQTASNSAAGILSNSNTTTTSYLTLQNGYSAYGQHYRGTFSGNLGLKITGGAIDDNNSIIMINRNNTYSGGTVVQGAIRVSYGSVLDSDGNIVSGSLGTGMVTMDGGTIQNNGNRTGGNLNPIDIANDILLTAKGGTFIAGWAQNRATFAAAVADVSNTASGYYKCYVTLSGKISDADTTTPGSLRIGGDGGWMVLANSDNDFSGETIIQATNSRLAITANNALSSNSVLKFENAGYVDLYGHSATAAGLFGTSGHVINSGTTAATLTLKPAETVTHTYNGVLSNLTLEVDYGSGRLVLGGNANNEGTTVVVKSGTVDLNKSENNAAPFLTIQGGTVRLTGSGGNQISDSQTLTMDSGMLDLYGKTETIGYLRQTAANGNAEITNTEATLARLTVNSSTGQTTPYFGQITGNLELVLKGGNGLEAAHLMINPQNTYSGGTTIQNGWARNSQSGTLDADGNLVAGCFGTGRIRLENGFITNNGGNRPGGVDVVTYLENDIEIASGGGGFRSGWGNNKTTFADAVADAQTYAGKRENHWYMVVRGKIYDAADATTPGNLQIYGDGGWTVFANSENDYSGNTILRDAYSRLAILADGALSPNSVVQFGDAAARLDLYGYSPTVAGLTGNGIVLNSGETSSTLTIATRSGEDSLWSGTLQNAVSLVISGSGTQTLAGTLSHTGQTVVESGTLVLNTALSSSEVVLAGGKFSLGTDGNYTTRDTIRVIEGTDASKVSYLDENIDFHLNVESGGIFSPGDAENRYGISTFATGKNLLVAEGGKLQIDILDAGTFDQWKVDFMTMGEGGLGLNIDSSADWHSLQGLEIATIGNLSQLDYSSWLSGWADTYFNLSSVGNQLYLSVDRSAVPEPGSWLLMILGLAVLGCRKWMWKKRSF
ncbi:MAG: PEP-CTERM sorting domain-containing protein [Planctomycetia bacterium]|nr:PEP-CTERM sorting domain-containing protein [Planctomycetia bacterium]